MNRISQSVRSKIMASIKGKDTTPEMIVRAYMHASGLRYRLHTRVNDTHPDLVFPRYSAAIFVHGCFWHQHRNCRHARVPTVRRKFWSNKFRANRKRDAKQTTQLLRAGWRVATIWECKLSENAQKKSLSRLYAWIQGNHARIEIG